MQGMLWGERPKERVGWIGHRTGRVFYNGLWYRTGMVHLLKYSA